MVRSISSLRSREEWDSRTTEERKRVRLTRAMASQNHRKIFRKRLRMGELFFPGLIGDSVQIADATDRLNALFAVREWAKFAAKIAYMYVDAAIEGGQIA